MRAIRQYEFGRPEVLRYEEVADPLPGPGELRISVAAAGVHVIDTAIRAGDSFGAAAPPQLPMTPGREVAGRVDRVGDGVDPSWVGKSVVAHLGAASGGYAELAVVAADRVHELPPHIDALTGVAAIGTGRTAAGILRFAELTSDDVVAVTAAAGGLGTLLLQGARNVGARTIALAGGPEKIELATKVGAETAVDYLADRWERGVPTLTVVLDGVGGEVGRTLYQRLEPGGRLVRYGWASGAENVYDDPDRRVVEVLGPPLVTRLTELETEALRAAADGTRVPYVGSVFPLAEAAAAHHALADRATTGKVVLVTRSFLTQG